MSSGSLQPTVFLADVQEYDLDTIQAAVRRGMTAVGVNPTGRVTMKVNTVLAHKRSSQHSFTRPELILALGQALNDVGDIDLPITITEKCGSYLRTKREFKRAGYYKQLPKHLFRLEPYEEAELAVVSLERGKLHKSITVAKALVDNDFLVYATKFKFNILVGGITGALKLNVGILAEEERMIYHDYRLDDKIVDLVEVGNPQLIVVDAITAGHGGSQMTPKPYPLSLVMVSNNPVAVDVVSNWIIGTDPHEVGHVVEAARRGYGPLEIEDIQLMGDDMKIFQDRAAEFETGFVPVHEFGTSMRIISGKPIPHNPGDTATYCTGGCHGILLDELLMTESRSPEHLYKPSDKVVVLAGTYEGDVTADTLIYVGDCALVEGSVDAKREVRVPGCPPSHKELAPVLAMDAGLYIDLLRLSIAVPEIPFLLPEFLKRIHRPLAWKTIWEILRHR